LGDDWYKCEFEFTAQQTANSVFIFAQIHDSPTGGFFSSHAGDGSSSLYMGGFIVRRAPAVDTYIQTTSAVIYELPVEYNSSNDAIGMKVEEQRTNECLHGSDLTDSAWTKTNCTTAKTATGPGGSANSATTLTADAANATCIQSITSASAERITSCYIKRRTGTGTINLTQDNGTTWTAVTVTNDWTRVNVPAATVTDPDVGIRIVTSGDEVDVALFQEELGARVSSPIETADATVTRSADDITLALSSTPLDDMTNASHALSMLVEYVARDTDDTAALCQLDDGSDNNDSIYTFLDSSGQPNMASTTTDAGAAVAAGTGTAESDGTTARISIRAEDDDYAASYTTGTQDTDSDADVMGTALDTIRIGARVSASHANTNIRKIALLPRGKTNTELNTDVA
jgi:hypothetical protein